MCSGATHAFSMYGFDWQWGGHSIGQSVNQWTNQSTNQPSTTTKKTNTQHSTAYRLKDGLPRDIGEPREEDAAGQHLLLVIDFVVGNWVVGLKSG
jgi:hypothetical protein